MPARETEAIILKTFPLGEAEPGALVRSMNLPREVQEDLFFRTACRWLGVKPEHFEE